MNFPFGNSFIARCVHCVHHWFHGTSHLTAGKIAAIKLSYMGNFLIFESLFYGRLVSYYLHNVQRRATCGYLKEKTFFPDKINAKSKRTCAAFNVNFFLFFLKSTCVLFVVLPAIEHSIKFSEKLR